MLTRKQHELLRFINERLRETGIPPSFDEMKDALDLKSKSGIHRLIMALEERGFIRRLPNRARALEVIRLPDGLPSSTRAAPQRSRFSPSIVQGGLGGAAPASGSGTTPLGIGSPVPQSRSAGRTASPASRGEFGEIVSIPVMGRIAAGTPISAIQDKTHSVSMPADMLSGGEHYALEVRGDSMIEAGIFDGDTVVIRRQDIANTGDIVVALIDEEEATLKRLRRRGSSIALEAANPSYETRVLGPDRVKIQGRLVGLLRRY